MRVAFAAEQRARVIGKDNAKIGGPEGRIAGDPKFDGFGFR